MPIITIDRKLNLVLPSIKTDKGEVYVHASPIGRSVFRDNYDILCDAYQIVQSNGGPISGPNRAALDVKRIAEARGTWERVRVSLIVEIERLTTVLYPGDRGWESIPYIEAVKQKIFNEDQAEVVEGFLVYFTLVSSMAVPEVIAGIDPLLTLWGAQTTSLNAMEFMNSLKTSTQEENTGEKPIPLRVRSQSSVPV